MDHGVFLFTLLISTCFFNIHAESYSIMAIGTSFCQFDSQIANSVQCITAYQKVKSSNNTVITTGKWQDKPYGCSFVYNRKEELFWNDQTTLHFYRDFKYNLICKGSSHKKRYLIQTFSRQYNSLSDENGSVKQPTREVGGHSFTFLRANTQEVSTYYIQLTYDCKRHVYLTNQVVLSKKKNKVKKSTMQVRMWSDHAEYVKHKEIFIVRKLQDGSYTLQVYGMKNTFLKADGTGFIAEVNPKEPFPNTAHKFILIPHEEVIEIDYSLFYTNFTLMPEFSISFTVNIQAQNQAREPQSILQFSSHDHDTGPGTPGVWLSEAGDISFYNKYGQEKQSYDIAVENVTLNQNYHIEIKSTAMLGGEGYTYKIEVDSRVVKETLFRHVITQPHNMYVYVGKPNSVLAKGHVKDLQIYTGSNGKLYEVERNCSQHTFTEESKDEFPYYVFPVSVIIAFFLYKLLIVPRMKAREIFYVRVDRENALKRIEHYVEQQTIASNGGGRANPAFEAENPPPPQPSLGRTPPPYNLVVNRVAPAPTATNA